MCWAKLHPRSSGLIMCGTKGRAPVPIFVRPAVPIVPEPVISRPTWFDFDDSLFDCTSDTGGHVQSQFVSSGFKADITGLSKRVRRLQLAAKLLYIHLWTMDFRLDKIFGDLVWRSCLAILLIKRFCDGYSDQIRLGEDVRQYTARIETYQRSLKADHMKSSMDKAISELRKWQSE